jgi:outer membrane immunogenic protein
MRPFSLAAFGAAFFAFTQIATAQPVPYTWTGFYIGANAGYSWGKSGTAYDSVGNGTSTFFTDSFDMNGGIWGAQAGFNYQLTPLFVAGVEVDIQDTGERGSGSRVACDPSNTCDTHTVNQTFKEKLTNFGTLRGRVGYLVNPNWLVYATGGVVRGKLKREDTYTNENTGNIVNTSLSDTKTGGVFGGGVEAVLWGNVTGRLEYLHFSLSGLGTQDVVNGQLTLTQTSRKFTDDIVRVSLNWRFGP